MKKNIKLSDQVKTYISGKRINFSASSISRDVVLCDDGDGDNETISSSNNQDEDLIRSDQLWAYLLNINPNSTPNLKKIISYIFSIPCSNSYAESIFNHMNLIWSDYRNRMNIKLVHAGLSIRMNADYSCEQFYKHILSETNLLKQIRQNTKYQQ